MIKDSHFLQLKKAIDAIHPIGGECFAKLKEFAKYRTLEKNEYFSKTGDFNEDFGFVINGILRIFYLSEGGQEHNKHFLPPNSFVAASIKSDQKSITSIQALSSTQLICIKFSSFISLVKKHDQLSVFMQKLIENYLEEKQKREIQLLS
ncbi:MAG: Crp/Fnr family transcriptional regulator, partial [Nanoarchaeota archaeon]|nr:Crp/Fnr family transcriptional regulator [Nanoarchaeota archaeon]